MKEIYVGNLPYSIALDEIQTLFAPYGTVYSAKLCAETEPKHPHAYAFVEMEDEDADEAIRMLDRIEFMGRTLRVEEAKIESKLVERF